MSSVFLKSRQDAGTCAFVACLAAPESADRFGFVAQAEAGQRVVQDLSRCSVLMMPSRAEGFGLSALEGIAHGVPVLISGQSGLAETVRSVLGDEADEVVIPVLDHEPDDSVAWAAAIRGVLADPQRAFERARLVRERLRTVCDWEIGASALIERLAPESVAVAVEPLPEPKAQIELRAPVIKWSAAVGIGTLKTRPIVDRGRVYVPTAGTAWNVPDNGDGVACLDVNTGTQIWHCPTGTDANSITLDADRIYVGTDGGHIFCIDAESGKAVWQTPLAGAVLARPIITSVTVIVCTVNGHVYGLSKHDGKLRHEFTADGPVVADPFVLADSLHIFTTTGAVHRIPIDSLLFHNQSALPTRVRVLYPSRYELNGTAACGFVGSPQVVGAVIMCSYTRYTYFEGAPICGLSVDQLEPMWITAHDRRDPEREFGNIRATLAVAGDLAVAPVCYGNEIVACSIYGQLQWVARCGTPFFPQYGSSAVFDDRVLTPRYDGYLHCVHAQTGALQWSISLGDPQKLGLVRGADWVDTTAPEWFNPSSAPLNSPLTIHDGVALALGADGYLHAVVIASDT